MKIAILGLRSIGPTALGGIEKVVEELSTRYVEAGHDRHRICPIALFWFGIPNTAAVKLKPLPAVYTKHLEAITNTVVAIIYALRGYDIVHVNALGPAYVVIHTAYFLAEKWS